MNNFPPRKLLVEYQFEFQRWYFLMQNSTKLFCNISQFCKVDLTWKGLIFFYTEHSMKGELEEVASR